MKPLLFVLSVIVLGVIGIIAIYLRFFAVLFSLLVNCLKLLLDAAVIKLFPGEVARPLETETD